MTARPKRARAAAPALSHERIRGEALRLIDREGLDDFSTRKLGRALGCEAMAIYYYYPSKEALLDAVVDQLMSGVGGAATDAGARDWVEALRQIAHGYRAIAKKHPRAFPLLATRRFATETTYAFLDALFTLARAQGLTDRTIARYFRAVSSYVNGIALNELAVRRTPSDLSPAALRARFGRVAAVQAWLEPRHDDANFEFGLELLLGALAGEAGGRTRRRPKNS